MKNKYIYKYIYIYIYVYISKIANFANIGPINLKIFLKWGFFGSSNILRPKFFRSDK